MATIVRSYQSPGEAHVSAITEDIVILCSGLMRRSGGTVQRCSADDQDRHLDFALGAARACPEGAAADS